LAHNINTYIGRQAGWHKLGTVTGQYMTWSEILQHGGLDYSVVKNQLEYMGVQIDAWGTFRSDNGVFLGTVGEGYTPINHSQGFELIDALVGSVDGAHYETAGVLGKGETVWGLADLNQRIKIGGSDDMNVYLLFSTSHDGTRSYNFRIVMERVVCQNTLDIALGEKTKASFTVRHTSGAQKKIADCHSVLANMGDDIKRVEDKLNFLAQRKMTREAMTTVMDRLFPKRVKADGDTPVNATRRENIIADVLKIYELNDGNAFPEQRGTAYNLLNAITNYTDHERSTQNGDTGRAESSMFGSGNRLKTNALEVIMEAANGLSPIAAPMPARQLVDAPMPAPVSFFDDVLSATVIN
jgi:phage/plasmid-like protein (TIGR03299 family)